MPPIFKRSVRKRHYIGKGPAPRAARRWLASIQRESEKAHSRKPTVARFRARARLHCPGGLHKVASTATSSPFLIASVARFCCLVLQVVGCLGTENFPNIPLQIRSRWPP